MLKPRASVSIQYSAAVENVPPLTLVSSSNYVALKQDHNYRPVERKKLNMIFFTLWLQNIFLKGTPYLTRLCLFLVFTDNLAHRFQVPVSLKSGRNYLMFKTTRHSNQIG